MSSEKNKTEDDNSERDQKKDFSCLWLSERHSCQTQANRPNYTVVKKEKKTVLEPERIRITVANVLQP